MNRVNICSIHFCAMTGEKEADMQFVNEELLVKIKTLPLDRRQKVIDGLVKMLAERPKGYSKEVKHTNIPEGVEV